MTTGRTTASGQTLSRAVRERFVAEVDPVVLELAATAQGRLSALAEQTGNVREQQQHRDTFLAFQRLRDAWVLDVRKAWSKALSGQARPDSRKAEPRSSMLTLIGDDEIENKILVSRLTLAIADKVSWELNDLRLRVSHLDNIADWLEQDVLKPDTFAGFLVGQWTQSGMSRASWQAVQDSLMPMVAERMFGAYQHANEFLIRNGVLPVLDRKQGLKRSAEGAPSTKGGAGHGAVSERGDLHSGPQDSQNWDRSGSHSRGGAMAGGGTGGASGYGGGGGGGGGGAMGRSGRADSFPGRVA